MFFDNTFYVGQSPIVLPVALAAVDLLGSFLVFGRASKLVLTLIGRVVAHFQRGSCGVRLVLIEKWLIASKGVVEVMVHTIIIIVLALLIRLYRC